MHRQFDGLPSIGDGEEYDLRPPAGRFWDDATLDWRTLMFLQLGFKPIPAKVLARSSVDWRDVRTLLECGCSHTLAIRIVAE